jgi:hypothetical protein
MSRNGQESGAGATGTVPAYRKLSSSFQRA